MSLPIEDLSGGAEPTPYAVVGTSGGDTPTPLPAGGENAVAISHGVVSDEWNLWIMRMALQGDRRYNDWLRHDVISNSVLSSRLAKLTQMGLLERVAYQDRPVRYEYVPTRRGRDLWPILVAIWSWEKSWAAADGHEELPTMRHARCGHEFRPVMVCAACKETVRPREVVGSLGPSGAWERTVPASTNRRRSRASVTSQPGTIPETMAVIGNRWSSALLGAAFLGSTRYSEFAARMGAPPAIVADRLRTFRELGVLQDSPSADRPDWVTYHLTDKGRALFPVVMCTVDWAQRWYVAPEGRALVIRHDVCRRAFQPKLACSSCAALLRGHEITEVPPDRERTP